MLQCAAGMLSSQLAIALVAYLDAAGGLTAILFISFLVHFSPDDVCSGHFCFLKHFTGIRHV